MEKDPVDDLTTKLSSIKIKQKYVQKGTVQGGSAPGDHSAVPKKLPELSMDHLANLHLKPESSELKTFWALYDKICAAKSSDSNPIDLGVEFIQLLFLNRFVRLGFINLNFASLLTDRFKQKAKQDINLCQKIIRNMTHSFEDVAKDHKKNPRIIDFVSFGFGSTFNMIKRGNFYEKILAFQMQLLLEKNDNCTCDLFVCTKSHKDFEPKGNDFKAAFEGALHMILYCYQRHYYIDEVMSETLRNWRKEVTTRITYSLNIQSTLRQKNEMRFRTLQELCCLISLECVLSSPTSSIIAREGLDNFRPQQKQTFFDIEKFNFENIEENIVFQEALDCCENSTKAKLFDVSEWNFDSSGKPLGEKKAEALLQIWEEETKIAAPKQLSVFIFLYLIKKLGCKEIRTRFRKLSVFGFKQTTDSHLLKQEEMVQGWVENVMDKLKSAHPNVCVQLSGVVDWLGVASSVIKTVTRAFQSLIEIEVDDTFPQLIQGSVIEVFVDWRKDCCKTFMDKAKHEGEMDVALIFSYLYHASNQMSHQDPLFNPKFFLFMLYRMVSLQSKYKSYYVYNFTTNGRTLMDETTAQQTRIKFQKLAEDIFKLLPFQYQNLIKNIKKD